MDFLNPDVYIQDVSSGSASIQVASATIGIMIGTTRSGKVGEAQLVGSFTEFIQYYANGLDTPFMSDSFLTYAVHGFFTNGGKQLYIIRVASDTAAKATKTGVTNNRLKLTAVSAGTWANQLSLKLTKSEDWTATNGLFDVTVTIGTSDTATITDVTRATLINALNSDIKVKEWLVAEEITGSGGGDAWDELTEEVINLAGGADGISDLTDTDYIEALDAVSIIDDGSFLAIPGQNSPAVHSAVMAYCDNNKLFPFLDMPQGSTVKATRDYRRSISAYGGLLAYPWGHVNDPLTNTLKPVPAAGHLMGVYARTIAERGIQKAPAGVNAVVRGFISMERILTSSDISQLNPVGVVCIQPRTNAGIVVWGARSLNNDSTMRYVSDVIINYTIKKSLYTGTQFAIFEPNTEQLWSRVGASCEAFLEGLRLEGALKGEKDEAYYVVVDSTNNTEATINAGILNVSIGYAPVKPAEFIIIKLAHTMESA